MSMLFLGLVCAVSSNPSLADPDIKLFDGLVAQIRERILEAHLDWDESITCAKICALLDNESEVAGKKLKNFHSFCQEKCPNLLVEAQALITAGKEPLQEKMLADFIIDVLRQHDEL